MSTIVLTHSYLTIIVMIALSCMTIEASSRPTGLDQYQVTFDQIPSPNFGRTLSIFRDNRGFLWLGTSKGLSKYDGYSIRLFTIGDPLDNEQQIITSIMRMDSVSLLLATGKGLWTFNLRTEQSSQFLPDTDISESRINAITQDHSGTVWIGSSSRGLTSYNRTSKAVQRYTTNNGLSSNRILSLLVDQSGRLWIGTDGGGLNSLDMRTSRIVHYRSRATDPSTLHTDNITALCGNTAGELWIGTNEGLNVLHTATGRMKRLDLHSHIKHTIMSLSQDPSGRMWIAVLDLGLVFYSNGSFTTFTTLEDAGRSLGSIRTLYPDPVASTGNNLLLWVGTRNGVNKIQISISPFINHIRNQDSLFLDRGAVLSICEDRNGVVWTGMWGGGLDMLRRANNSYLRVNNFKNSTTDPSSLPHNDVGAIMEDAHRNLWIGTAGGLAILDASRKRMLVYKHVAGDSTSLLHNDVAGIYEDRSGTMWICTRGGLSEVVPGEPRRFKNYLNDPNEMHAVEGNFVSEILQDRHSHRWVATYGRGLNKLDANGTFKRYLHPGDSSRTQENWIFCFVEDRDGLFWLSTMAGLVSFDSQSGQFTRHKIKQLHNAHIFGIHVDTRNDLWLSTGIGLVKFSPTAQSFTRFDENYGIGFTELRSGFFKNTKSKLFVGGLDGFTEFDPDSIPGISHPPEIAITALSVFDDVLSASALTGGQLLFPHDQNFLSFSFAALDYANPRQNRFAYRMFGVDNTWVDAGTRNSASYANLNPGNYVFRVRGSNSNNVWNETGTSISIVITPPYWQTWWFRLLFAGCIAGTIYAVYRYRLRKLLEVERLRLRIADDLHDDVGSNLSAIAMVSRAVQRAPELTPASKEKIAEIYSTAILTSQGMKDLVWFIKPENDSLGDLILRMKDTASTLLSDTELHFHSPKPDESRTIAIDFKRSVFLAFKEIITNIAKHAIATRVEINVVLREGMFEISIADNGRGFVEEDTQPGNGLQSLRKRALTVGGQCEITSRLGEGTTVRFTGTM